MLVELQFASERFPEAMRRRGARVLGEAGSRYRLAWPADSPDIGRELFEVAREVGAQVRGFRPALRTLEDVFLEATQ